METSGCLLHVMPGAAGKGQLRQGRFTRPSNASRSIISSLPLSITRGPFAVARLRLDTSPSLPSSSPNTSSPSSVVSSATLSPRSLRNNQRFFLQFAARATKGLIHHRASHLVHSFTCRAHLSFLTDNYWDRCRHRYYHIHSSSLISVAIAAPEIMGLPYV